MIDAVDTKEIDFLQALLYKELISNENCDRDEHTL